MLSLQVHVAPLELEISDLVLHSVLLVSVRQKAEIVPYDLALASVKDEVLLKNTFIVNLNVEV